MRSGAGCCWRIFLTLKRMRFGGNMSLCVARFKLSSLFVPFIVHSLKGNQWGGVVQHLESWTGVKKILLGSALDETLVYLGSGVSQQLRSSASHVSASTLFLSGSASAGVSHPKGAPEVHPKWTFGCRDNWFTRSWAQVPSNMTFGVITQTQEHFFVLSP